MEQGLGGGEEGGGSCHRVGGYKASCMGVSYWARSLRLEEAEDCPVDRTAPKDTEEMDIGGHGDEVKYQHHGGHVKFGR